MGPVSKYTLKTEGVDMTPSRPCRIELVRIADTDPLGSPFEEA